MNPQERAAAPWLAALERLRGAYADKTLREYRNDFTVFQRWCEGAGLSGLPATPEVVARFVSHDIASRGVRTVKRRLFSIGRVHRLMDFADPTRDDQVALAFRRGLRTYGRRTRQALGLTAKLRDRLMAACPETLIGVRDRAMIAVGYDTLCRRSELMDLRLEDLVVTAGRGKILVRSAKNDPFGDGRYAYLSTRGLAELRSWIRAARVTSGPLFRGVFGSTAGGRAPHPRVVNRRLHLLARRAGLDEEVVRRLTGHSMRVGAAQDLVVAGCSVLQIMRAGRWTNVDAVGPYVRGADLNVWA